MDGTLGFVIAVNHLVSAITTLEIHQLDVWVWKFIEGWIGFACNGQSVFHPKWQISLIFWQWCLDVLQDVKALATRPNLVCYSSSRKKHKSLLLVCISFRRLWVSSRAPGVPQCSDEYSQWRQSVPAQTAATGTRQSLRRTAGWTPELRPRRRSQIPGSPSECSQRRRGRGCAYEEGGVGGGEGITTRHQSRGRRREGREQQEELTTLALTPRWRPFCCRCTSCWWKSRCRWRRRPGRGSPPDRWRWAAGPPAWTPARHSARRGSASIYPRGICRRRTQMDVITSKKQGSDFPISILYSWSWKFWH